MKNQLLFLLCFLAGGGLFAQSDLDNIFDEKVLSESRLILKTNPITMLNGDFPIYAEARLTSRISIEAGVGLIFGYFLDELSNRLSNSRDRLFGNIEEAVQGGWSWRIQARIMRHGDENANMEGLYGAPTFRQRVYNFKDRSEKVIIRDFVLISGYQMHLVDRLSADFYIGLGYRYRKFKNVSATSSFVGDDRSLGLVFPIGVKLGWYL